MEIHNMVVLLCKEDIGNIIEDLNSISIRMALHLGEKW